MTVVRSVLIPLYARLARPTLEPRPLAALGLRALRRLAPVFGDPLVELKLDGTALCIPLSHDLGAIRTRLPHYSSAIGRLAASVAAAEPDAAMIDIGANVGDTVAIVRRHADLKMLCIEASSFYFELLKRNTRNIPQVELVHCLVADDLGGSAQLQHARGSASPVRLEGGTRGRTLAEIVAELPVFSERTRILKIDTDGMDGAILRGSRTWLAQKRPIIAFEYDPYLWARAGDNDAMGVFGLLSELGYERALFYENEGSFVAEVAFDAQPQLASLHRVIVGARGRRYYDVFAFSPDESERHAAFRATEAQGASKSEVLRPLAR
jgi:FkbM family methyltransferase